MKSLYRKNDVGVESAYIITVKGNENSERFSKRCQESCEKVGMPYKVWEAFNGMNPGSIVPPPHLVNESVTSMIKLSDHYLTRGEVACALSHISLWVHCAVIDRPIVILEHDAVMLKKFEFVESYNSIVYLGGTEWSVHNWDILPIPPHASEGPNKHFICRAHAYAIDPIVAKNMVSYVIKQGIMDPLDIMIRADLFNITHKGMFATDVPEPQNTTILSRPELGRTTRRNDNLEW